MKFLKSRGVLFFVGFSSSSLLFSLFLSLSILFYILFSFPFLSFASDATLPTKFNSFATSFCVSQLPTHSLGAPRHTRSPFFASTTMSQTNWEADKM